MQIIDGLRVSSLDDSSFRVSNAKRVLGAVVRHLVPAEDGKGCVWKWRTFGQDFDSMRAAVREFLEIQGVRRYLYDAKGDA